MIFFGYGNVWDKENNNFLCKFDRFKGTLETEDKRIIKILQDLGYEYLDEPLQQRKRKTIREKKMPMRR